MASSSLLPCLLLLLLPFLFHQSLAHNVDDACKSLASSNWTVDFDFCATSLKANPKSKTADTRGLALIAAQLTVANATACQAKIKQQLLAPIDPLVKVPLGLCLGLYTAMIPNFAGSVEAIRSGHFQEAVAKLELAKDKPYDCEKLFSEEGKASPVEEEDNDTAALATIATVLTVSLV